MANPVVSSITFDHTSYNAGQTITATENFTFTG